MITGDIAKLMPRNISLNYNNLGDLISCRFGKALPLPDMYCHWKRNKGDLGGL